ncbi:MAG TPA: transcriptional regulator [Desulfurivibrio alkaliphilus]|uniref:Transcriptional regulator n=1 Tax=Desulfurivibrio alkaliphilus TaxID=427923 RepID=A0A7C2TGP8_9BACT|nr:transcriptional regulator [Desulfurivibrio alkaliphilus]
MESSDFFKIRKKLQKTQKEISELLGTSIKAIHSYEQGWRSIPPHVERQMYFLVSRQRELHEKPPRACWTIKKCPPSRKRNCPAWEFRAGKMCWFINGTICECNAHKNWKEKMVVCKECEVMKPLL